MNDTIIYRPYKTQTWPLVFTIPVGILAFMGAGYCLPLSGVSVLCLAGVGIACIWLTKVLYDSSKRAVFFEQKGLRIIDGSYFDYRYVLWEELSYAYYVRSFKGHFFLVLSSNALSPKEAKHFANRGANSSRICIDSVLVIYIDIFQDASQLRELIENHVVHIDTY